jgi:hypothetical protein
MENRLTAVEIINETVEFYSEDTSRRSIGPTMCLYNGSEGRKCAYSRCWMEAVWKPEYEDEPVGYSLMSNPDELVEVRYRGQTIEFWSKLQTLHDVSRYWDKNGLTECGKEYVVLLLEQYS